MNIRTETIGTIAVMYFSGAADITTVPDIRNALARALQDSAAHVVCDLSNLDFVCSAALGAFISAEREARSTGCFLRLVHPQRRIAEIFTTTQLDRLFSIYESVNTAVADAAPTPHQS